MLPDLESLGVEDRNHDGIADYLNTRIYVAEDANAEALAAAANIAARLAFETVSLDLPLAFPVSSFQPGSGQRSILVGCDAKHAGREGALVFSDIHDADVFSRKIGLETYTAQEAHAETRPPENFTLDTALGRIQRIVIGRNVRSRAVIDLAARVALESTELSLPLVVVVEESSQSTPTNSILVGLSHPGVRQLMTKEAFSPPTSAGQGCIAMVDSCLVIFGTDESGEARALEYASLQMPFITSYGKGQPSLLSIEDNVRRYIPSGKPATELVLEETFSTRWEVEDALQRLHETVIPAVSRGDVVHVDVRLSEPSEIRRDLAVEIQRVLFERGADPESSVRILSAHKQGFGWIDEELKPRLKSASQIRIRFRQLECDDETLDSPERWLHELYPIDEILARDIGLPADAITFECVPPSSPHIYEVDAFDAAGNLLLHSTFSPHAVERPLFDLFPEYARARVATGWLTASVKDRMVVSERIKTDYERFWDGYQEVFPKIRDYVLRLHDGRPDPESAPHFEELTVDVELSEPDSLLGLDEERISTLEALHEDIYFETLLFFEVLGTTTCDKPLKYPGRIIPRVRPSRPGAGQARIRLIGYRSPFPVDIPFIDKDPRVTAITVQAAMECPVSVEVSARETRFCWLPDGNTNTNDLRKNGEPLATERIVPLDAPIGPNECERLIAQLADFPEIRPFVAGNSWLGRPVWAMDVIAPAQGKYFSEAKAAATKPCLFVTGRQHANEVSSTSHILKLAELLATDPEHRALLKKVNIILQPMTNPDGSAVVEELHRITPGFMLHAGYLGALGVDVTDQQWSQTPKYPEARIRADLWRMWQPDIVLNPHGYPSHEWVQLFAGYTAWVRSKSRKARDWWIPRGWFMPRFEYIDDERFAAHRSAAMNLADKIAAAIQLCLGPVNDRMYRRYAKYMSCDMELHHGILLRGLRTPSKPDPDSFGFMTRHPEITFFEGLSEAPDEVASGSWLKTLAQAGLEFSLVHARFLAELPSGVIRTRTETNSTVVLHLSRKRLPLGPGL